MRSHLGSRALPASLLLAACAPFLVPRSPAKRALIKSVSVVGPVAPHECGQPTGGEGGVARIEGGEEWQTLGRDWASFCWSHGRGGI